MLEIRRADDRGKANYGWLDTRYSFSFAEYYDPKHMGFSALRVINDDLIAPAAGFPTHGHKNMEIISYIIEGAIAHKDSQGNTTLLSAGEYQLMSAGKGVFHSEFNASQDQELKLLQIWIEPNQVGTLPDYQQKPFAKSPGLTKIVSPDGSDNSMTIKQDASLFQLVMEKGELVNQDVSKSRSYYIHVVSGKLMVNESQLNEGDALKIANIDSLVFKNAEQNDIFALVFELP